MVAGLKRQTLRRTGGTHFVVRPVLNYPCYTGN